MKKFLNSFEEIFAGAFLIVMITVVIVNVFLRYLFSATLYWAEEVSTICFVWAVFLGASASYKHRMDIGIDVLVKKLPEGPQKIARSFVDMILLVLSGYLFYMSIVYTSQSFQKPTAVLGVSSSVVSLALVVSFGLICLHTLSFVISDWQDKGKQVL